MSITLLAENCVRTLSISSECSVCKDNCLVGAVNISSNVVKIDHKICTECGDCVGICPTGAIGVKDANITSCSVEELICLAKDTDIELLIDAKLNSNSLQQNKVDEANAILAAFGIANKVTVSQKEGQKEQPIDGSKRVLFRMFTKEGISAASEAVKTDEEYKNSVDYLLLKQKKLPQKRELFLSFCAEHRPKETETDSSYPLSFATEKHIDDTCDNCSLCYNLCPSGALETTAMKNAIIFSAHLCLKCKLCEDVCEKKSITSLPVVTLSVFAERKKKVLKKFAAKLCPTCGAVFAAETDECARCTKESEDARELLGL